MLISNIHNRTPKSSLLFTDICIGDFFNRDDFMKHWVKVMFCYTGLFIDRKWEYFLFVNKKGIKA